MTKAVTQLDDKYAQSSGRVFISANQALVRLPLEQARRDRAAGAVTAGYISGYRGSPLGVYDVALWGARKLLEVHDIQFAPGLNEELAATAIRGTQQLNWFGTSRFQGVFGLWYGKGLGVDRACESLKLGNLEGSAALGGFLAVAGDDHGGKSSASAHQSEHTLIAGFLPVLYPSTIGEILEFGIHAWALSRYSGLYVGLKCITDTLDLTASVELPNAMRPFAIPEFVLPPEGLNLRSHLSPLTQEDWVVTKRLPAAAAFARANSIDRTPIDGPLRGLGIVAAGKAYLDVRQALRDLGLDENRCRELGIRIYKPGMIWPLENTQAVAFAEGHRAILVVEEKRPVIEDQLARALYGLPANRRPDIAGKLDLSGAPLVPAIGELNALLVRKAIRTVLKQIGLADEQLEQGFERVQQTESRAAALGSAKSRPAFFCSGCPHNTSTRIPDGSIAISAVGCHGLAAYVTPERRTMPPMPMGGDGMPWVAVGPLVDRPHIFQNMGDGTYSHSGILAIRAAVAARAHMTFKILYNDAVAMTGGQPVEMQLTPVDVIKQLLAEGVTPVHLVSDDPERYSAAMLPAGIAVHHRDDLDRLQRQLRELKSVSAIVYEQTCAAEKRRRRKRGSYPDPDTRVFINQDVCEGCGDCSVQSNCISVQPLETEFGRKRTIDQSNCNKDYSCIKGFCPSFVTVTGAKIATREQGNTHRLDELIAKLLPPTIMNVGHDTYNILVAGIGGTGVLTVGAVLGMAAHLDGKGCTVLDQTGMAQKGGAVTSHIRIGRDPSDIFTSRLGVGMSDVIIACDLVVGAGADVMKTVQLGRTTAVVNLDVTPTGEFQTNQKMELNGGTLERTIRSALGGGALHSLHATRLATELLGDSIATNLLMVGYAAQAGLIPVSVKAIEDAIRLNGTFVDGNLRTFALGRVAAHSPDALAQEFTVAAPPPALDTLDAVIASGVQLLTEYQNAAYASEYRAFVRAIHDRVSRRAVKYGEILVSEVASTLARLMAYKDEYEVARLHTDPRFWQRLNGQFSGDYKVTFHLAPPMLPGRDSNGRPQKRAFGQWIIPVFRFLRSVRGLRGTAFDPFGYIEERRTERRLIREYRTLMEEVVDKVFDNTFDKAIEIAKSASEIRGYGPVKKASLAEYRRRTNRLLEEMNPTVPSTACETTVGST